MNNKVNAESLAPQLDGLFSIGFLRNLLKGTGQVMFQNNIWTGLFFLIGIFVGAYQEGQPLVAWGALVALIVSSITAYILPLSREDQDNGLWGFNGILVGCAFLTFLGSTVFTWLALIFCAMFTTWLRVALNNVMAPWKVNSLTFPFVLLTWIFLFSARMFQGIPPTYMSTPELTSSLSSAIDLGFVNLVEYWLKGISQVFLINSWITGIFFLIALFLSNKWAAIWAAIGSAVALFIAILFKAPGADVAEGLYGFSAVLTGIALGMTFYQVNYKTAIWALVGIIATVFVQAGMNGMLQPFGLPSLTAPFCLTTWFFLLPLFKFNVNKNNDDSSKEADHSWWHKKKENS